jgi:hypothetical protein
MLKKLIAQNHGREYLPFAVGVILLPVVGTIDPVSDLTMEKR